MEEEKVADHIQPKSSSPVPTGIPINWGLITGPVPEPVFTAPSLSTRLPPPPCSAVHALQNKVKSLTPRRARGKEREKERERLDADVLRSSSAGQISTEVLLRQRPRGKGQVFLTSPSWRSGVAKNLSSSDEEEEVKVQVSFEVHSPPAGARGERLFQEVEETEDERSERNEDQVGLPTGRPCGLGEGTSLESLLSDNSSSSKDDPSPPPPTLPPPPLPALSSSPATTSAATTASASSSTPTRHWAPPKGFWRVVRPETLLLNGVSPIKTPSTLPSKDRTEAEAPSEPRGCSKAPETGSRSDAARAVEESDASAEFKDSDSVECYLDRCEQKELNAGDAGKGLCSSDSSESMPSPSGLLPADDKLKVKRRAYVKLRERSPNCTEESEQSGGECAEYSEDTTYRGDCKGGHGVLDSSKSAILPQELEPYLRSLLVISDEHPLSSRHEQAKLLLERARLKARSNHIKGDRPGRRSHSDQRSSVKKPQIDSPIPTRVQKAVPSKEDLVAQTVSGPLLMPNQDPSQGDQGVRSRRYGCSPTRVRFEDESEKEAESRYLDRLRQRSRSGMPKSKSKESNTDSSSSGSDRSRGNQSVPVPPSQKKDGVGVSGEPTTVIKEIIVLVKKCEACGSVVKEPQPVSSPSEPKNTEPQQAEDPREKAANPSVPHSKPEASTRPKAPLTVTFAGAYVLGESKESHTGWKRSGFGKLRRRSRKGESRMESDHGPYGPSWAQRRNSNPRNRVNLSRAVSFGPDSPVALEPHLLEAPHGLRESPPPSLPIKSALKSSSRNRSAAGQSTVQFQTTSNQGGEGGSQHSGLLDSPEARREGAVASTQGGLATSNPVPCIRPSTLRYSPARLTTDLQAAELWDATPDGAGHGEPGSGPDCRPAPRGIAMSRAEDLRAELLRAEHLRAEAIWEENSDGSRKLDGRPKLFLRRFFSSIGLNSVGRLVKGGRSSSMEQLSLPTAPRVSSASPSPTRRPHPIIRMQRTPSLQTLNTVLPLAQLRKASSVQSLERRTERSTILGEVQIPYGLAPSPDSPQLDLHRALSVEDVRTSRIARPVGRVTQAFPDGTLLLELVRPPNGPFGFVISRGKGRPDTGVYVEKVGDGGGEGPYIGLLSIGDEILQVNGEAVAGLSLDHVTRLMTRESTASLRIVPARRSQR
ncbi:kiaa1614 [Pungitius sinensis]